MQDKPPVYVVNGFFLKIRNEFCRAGKYRKNPRRPPLGCSLDAVALSARTCGWVGAERERETERKRERERERERERGRQKDREAETERGAGFQELFH